MVNQGEQSLGRGEINMKIMTFYVVFFCSPKSSSSYFAAWWKKNYFIKKKNLLYSSWLLIQDKHNNLLPNILNRCYSKWSYHVSNIKASQHLKWTAAFERVHMGPTYLSTTLLHSPGTCRAVLDRSTNIPIKTRSERKSKPISPEFWTCFWKR